MCNIRDMIEKPKRVDVSDLIKIHIERSQKLIKLMNNAQKETANSTLRFGNV